MLLDYCIEAELQFLKKRVTSTNCNSSLVSPAFIELAIRNFSPTATDANVHRAAADLTREPCRESRLRLRKDVRCSTTATEFNRRI